MKILYMTQHYPPEAVAAAFRSYDMAQRLAGKGHEVTVITGYPNVPDLRREKKYRNKLYFSEYDGRVRIIRVYTPIDTKEAKTVRLYNYFGYMYLSFMAGLFKEKPDVIYSSMPPLFVAVSGMALKEFKNRNTRFVVEVRDLWVDFAVMLGELRRPFLIKFARWLENYVYSKADAVVAVTEGYRSKLLQKGVDGKIISVVQNGVDFNDPACGITEENEDLIKEYNLEDKFVVCYAGNIGNAQGLGVVIEAARLLRDSGNNDVFFVLIGNGADKERLVALSREYGLDNVLFLDHQSRQAVVKCINAGDCCLVTLKNHELFHVTLPSKLFDYMAFARPILLGVDGEARGILEDAGAGLYFDVDDPRSLIAKINAMQDDKGALEQMGDRGREYVYEHFNRKVLADKLNEVLVSVVEK